MRASRNELVIRRIGFFVRLQAGAGSPLSRVAKEKQEFMKPPLARKFLIPFVFGISFCLTVTGRAQEASPSPTPSPTPPLYSPQTLSDLKQIQQAALKSDYAYRQVAHLSNNIGPRLSGSAQAQKAVDYVAAELKAIGLDVQLEKVMVPHWVRGEETAT